MNQTKTKSRPNKSPPHYIQMAQALLNSHAVRGTLDENDPKISKARKIIAAHKNNPIDM